MVEDDIISVLKRTKLFKGLGDQEIHQIHDFSMPLVKEFDKNEVIVNQGDLVHQIGIIRHGTVHSTKYHYNGETQILRIYKQGEILSLDTVSTTTLKSPVSLICQTPCAVIFIGYRTLLKLIRSNLSLGKLLFSTAVRFSAMSLCGSCIK